jgi:hypothetical protein
MKVLITIDCKLMPKEWEHVKARIDEGLGVVEKVEVL